jgi:hypothetical protein
VGADLSIQTESRAALRELIDLLREVDERWASPEWNLRSEADVAGAHRALMHILEGGICGMFECDPAAPLFRRIVTPWRKFTGDNADAIYFDAPVSSRYRYRVRGETNGAVYVSLTVEVGTEEGAMATRTAGVLNDAGFDVDADGRFDVVLGGPPQPRNWLGLPETASRITTRHYFEEAAYAAADPAREPRLAIEVEDCPGAPPAPSDADVAAGIRRVAGFVRSRTLAQPPMAASQPPPFVSIVPNRFPPPVPPGDFGLAASDAAYSMAPFVVGPDDALVLRGRWPRCRCANVSLWTRHLQTFDYANRRVSLNRAQTQAGADGRFTMVLAHRDPGVPNWLDTEGRPFGLVFWRFLLPEGEIETPAAEVVPFAEVGSAVRS